VSWLTRTLSNPTGKKVLVAITGLALVVFLIGHLAGNLLIYAGPEAMNAYAECLHHLPGFAAIEVSLLLCFMLHIGLVLQLTLENRAARGAQGYAVSKSKQTRGVFAVIASKTMAISGIIVLVFVVVHLLDLRFQRGDGETYDQVIRVLSNPAKAALYCVGSLLVSWHLFHGFQSAFRSLGLGHAKYSPTLGKLGAALALIFAVGFASIPVWIMITKGG
jgi:succinate dehydrogenase / fumarate reductase cytochrome b subunit